MHLRAEAILLSIRSHGEHGAVVRALTEEHGLLPGYVRGGRSRRLRPVLQPANIVLGDWRARTEEQLAALTVEPIRSRAALFAEPLPAAALEWVTALAAATLPEGQPYPRIWAALDGVIGAVEAAPSARGWALPLARYELLLLAELGYGLDADRLPQELREGGSADWPAIFAALRTTGEALERNLLAERRADLPSARARLVERLQRAVA
ncbi:DNA repair protein RecO [Sphingomonas aracearum]|uniref:DNA repair protein RecO n=1 Tax=Sphingomonas aracearum TaxID=2283317 RepID=A0A369VVV7_9SPHN|nr:DNA repair protein RecO [Sphingomonas aracearum]RDE05775.1 DNA repair protein RecO [Sphingomonas aracearum]